MIESVSKRLNKTSQMTGNEQKCTQNSTEPISAAGIERAHFAFCLAANTFRAAAAGWIFPWT